MAFENFKGKTFTVVTSSEGVEHKETYRKVPSVLTLGVKEKTNGGFFNYDLILSASDKNLSASFYDDNAVFVEQDTGSKEVAVYLTASIFRKNMSEYLQYTAGFPSESYTQLSASFFSQIGNAVDNMSSDEAYIGILTSQFESGSVGSGTDIIQPVTASLTIAETPGLATDAAGNPRQRKITYINSSSNSTNAHFFFNFDELNGTGDFGDDEQKATTDALVAAGKTHLTRSFTAHTTFSSGSSGKFYYVQPKHIPQFSIAMSSSNNTASFFALTASFSGAADFGVLSGSFIGKTIESGASNVPRHYNGTYATGVNPSGDETDGTYNFVVQKGIIEGEGEFSIGEDNYGGDTGANVAFTPQQLYVWYPSKYTYANVRSASYYFIPYPENMHELNTGTTTKALVTGSISSSEDIGTGELRTLYWLNHTFTSSFTTSFGHFTGDELRNQTGNAANHQLPYMNTSIRRFGRKNNDANASHLWKDTALSIPADEGYYVHSSSFSQESKDQMTGSVFSGGSSTNHSSSFFVMGVFKHPFAQIIDGAIMNYTASQEGEEGVGTLTFMNQHPIASCMFLKRYDDQVFIYQPKDGQAVISESVG